MAFAFRKISPLVHLARCIHSTPAQCKLTGFDRINFFTGLYRKYGLLKDDMLPDCDPDVKEALARIPEDMLMKRIYRSVRAQQLYLEHNVLPTDQWTTLDDDHEYLMPYLREVQAENRERDEWERNH